MPVDTTLYDILGVEPNASASDIRKAYRKKAMLHHPDKNPNDPRAAQKFQELGAAYEILSKEEPRSAYDRYGLSGTRNTATGDASYVDPEIFAQFFNGGFGGFHFGFDQTDTNSQNEDTLVPLDVTLEDLFVGKTLKMSLEREILCNLCNGSGAKPSHKPKLCSRCSGKGWVHRTTHLDNSMYGTSRSVCSECNGEGATIREKDRCKKCKGKRTTIDKKRLDVFIKPGMADGAKITLKGEGDHKRPDRLPGDVIFQLKTQPHSSYRRAQNNLMTKVHLTLSEALLGFSRVVATHLDGRGLKVTSPKGKVLKTGDSIILRGKGMPILDSPTFGDLFVLFEVEMPSESWMNTIDTRALERLLPPKKPPTLPNITSIDEGVFEQTDITEFDEAEEDWVDESDDDENCVHQ